MIIKNKLLSHQTKGEFEFKDITDEIQKFIENSKVRDGLINIQSLHTTAMVLVNENEPLLIEDMKNNFRDLAKKDQYYGHNDFTIRTVNMCGPSECKNGHSHCLAAYLPTSVTINVIKGKLSLGKWQRIFLIELDHARPRDVQLQIIGE